MQDGKVLAQSSNLPACPQIKIKSKSDEYSATLNPGLTWTHRAAPRCFHSG